MSRWFWLVLVWIIASPSFAVETRGSTGTLDLENGGNDLIVEVSDQENHVVHPVSPLHFELPVGPYTVKVRPADDIAWLWTWTSKVDVTAENPTVVAIPNSAKTHTQAWQTNHDKLEAEKLQARRQDERKRRDKAYELAGWSLGLGTLSLVSAGAFFWAGNVQRQDYNNATNSADATRLHLQLSVESAAFFATLAGACLGWGISAYAALSAPSVEPEVKP